MAASMLDTLAKALQTAAHALIDAKTDYCAVLSDSLGAKRALEMAEAQRLSDGVEGSNEAQRRANLRLALADLYRTTEEAEDKLNEAKCQVEMAEIEWQLVRYQVRLLEASPAYPLKEAA